MSLKNILRKGSVLVAGSALLLSIGMLPSSLHELPVRNLYYAGMKKQVEQEFLRYEFKIYVLGFKLANKTMTWDKTITEDSKKVEYNLDVALRASSKYWMDLKMKKIDYKDKNLEGLLEEYSYALSDGEKIKKGSVEIYPDRAEIYYNDNLLIKRGRYKGVLSFLQDIMEGNMKLRETRNMDVLFGKDVFRFKYKVVGEETLYEKYDLVRDEDTGDLIREGRGKSFETYKIQLKIQKYGEDKVRKGIYFWIGKEGKHKGEVVNIEIDYNWALNVEMLLKDLF